MRSLPTSVLAFSVNRLLGRRIADTGEYVSDRQAFQFFPTPKALAHEIVKIADIRDGEDVYKRQGYDYA